MRIAFINPPYRQFFSRPQRSPAVTKGGTLYYPYWLAMACGYAEKYGHKSYLYDFIAKKKNTDEAIKDLQKNRIELAVIDCSTPSIQNDLDFAGELKKAMPGIKIVAVGTHVSALPQEILKIAAFIDAVALGEYDQTIVEMADCLQKKRSLTKVAGLCLRRQNKFCYTAKRPFLSGEQLDQIPFASKVYKKFLKIDEYYFAAAHHPMVMIISARGCPFGCNFCLYWQTLHGKTHRTRSPENVVSEFKYIAKEMPEVREIVIEDDTFTANIMRVRKICKLLIQKKNKLKWCANVRVGVDLETLKLMKQAGCRLIITGFESGNQQVLDNMGKHTKVGQALELVKNAQQAGLLVHGCFMVGNPGETPKTMKETFELALKLNCDSAQFYPLYVYPGTISYNWFKARNLISSEDYSRWLKKDGEHNTVINLPGLTSADLDRFCEKAYLKYYFRPTYLWLKIKQLSHPSESVRSLRSFLNYFRTKIAN